jgi:hypothetical protein
MTGVAGARRIRVVAVGAAAVGAAWAAIVAPPQRAAETPAFGNLDLTFEERAADLVSRMTLD